MTGSHGLILGDWRCRRIIDFFAIKIGKDHGITVTYIDDLDEGLL